MQVEPSFEQALLLHELHLAQGRATAGHHQIVSAAPASGCAAIKLNRDVVLASLPDFRAVHSFQTPQSGANRAVGGVSFSPCGQYLAAFSSDELYVARVVSVDQVGQLQHAAQLAGIRRVMWCEGSTALAVCCKQQVDVYLLVLPPCPPSTQQPQPGGQQQPALALAPLQRLAGPRSATAGPRCAAWLPRSSAAAPAALLAAWPSDLLMYTWRPTGLLKGVVDWNRHKVHRFLAGWPGPVRALTAAACMAASSSSSGGISCSSSDSSIVLGTVDAMLALDQPGSGGSTSSQIPINLHLSTAHQQAGGSFISELSGDGSAAAGGGGAATGEHYTATGPYPDVVLHGSRAGSSNGSVLGSLMNLAGQTATNGSPSSNSSGSNNAAAGNACLCMLQINLAEFLQSQSTSSGGSSGLNTCSNGGSRSSGGSGSSFLPKTLTSTGSGRNAGPGQLDPSALAAGTATPFSSMLLLPHLPLPDMLAVHNNIAAVGSSTGSPLVTLCSFDPTTGLQLLQTVTIPLPTAAPPHSRARMEGLLLCPAVQQQQGFAAGAAGSSAFSFSNQYPVIPEGGYAGMMDPPAPDSSGTGAADTAALLPDIVALMTYSQGQTQGGFTSIGGSAVDRTADTFLLKARAPQSKKQQQPSKQSVALPDSSATAAAAAAAAVSATGEPSTPQPSADADSIWFGHLEHKQLKGKSLEAEANRQLRKQDNKQQQEQQQKEHQRCVVQVEADATSSAAGLLRQQYQQRERRQSVVSATDGSSGSSTGGSAAAVTPQQQQATPSTSAGGAPCSSGRPPLPHQQQQQQQSPLQRQDSLEALSALDRVNRVVSALNGMQTRMQGRLEASEKGPEGLSTIAALNAGMMEAQQEFMIERMLDKMQQHTTAAAEIAVASVLAKVQKQTAAAVQTAVASVLEKVQPQLAAAAASGQGSNGSSSQLSNQAVAGLEARLDAMQQRQQQNLALRLESENAVATALTVLQNSLVRKIDAMHGTLLDMNKLLERLAVGIEEMEGGGN